MRKFFTLLLICVVYTDGRSNTIMNGLNFNQTYYKFKVGQYRFIPDIQNCT